MDKDIKWVEAFNDEGFMRELRKTFDEFLVENTASEDTIDKMFEEIFKYDEKDESVTIDTKNIQNIGAGEAESSDDEKPSQAEDEEIVVNQKIKMMLLLLLMKDNGLKVDKNNMTGDKDQKVKHENHGNGVRAANLMHTITGIPLQTCKNFISNPRISSQTPEDILTKINAQLIEMELKIRINKD